MQYLTGDLVGSTRLITNSTGNATGVNLYNEYGNLTSHTGTATSAIGYTGNWTDPDTGLVYLRARDYDPASAQFLTVDPLVDQTRQPYEYVADNPLKVTDLTGECALSWLEGIGVDLGNGFLSEANALENHPELSVQLALEYAGIVLGLGGEIGGFALDFTGIGAILGVPANVAAGALLAGSVAGAASSLGQLTNDAAGADRVDVLQNTDSTASGDAGWPTAGHADQLPQKGNVPYTPPKGSHDVPQNLGNGQGFLDDQGQRWVWDKSGHGGPHWDVQLKGGGHINVYPDGHVR